MTRGEGGWLFLPSAGLSPAILRQLAWRTSPRSTMLRASCERGTPRSAANSVMRSATDTGSENATRRVSSEAGGSSTFLPGERRPGTARTFAPEPDATGAAPEATSSLPGSGERAAKSWVIATGLLKIAGNSRRGVGERDPRHDESRRSTPGGSPADPHQPPRDENREAGTERHAAQKSRLPRAVDARDHRWDQ